jgi:hypothetical protein
VPGSIRVERVWDLATEVLAVVEDGYAAAGVELPARRLVTPGTPAFDCDMLAVWVDSITEHQGDINAPVASPIRSHPGATLRRASINVTILRCVPVVDLTEDGAIVLPDVQLEEAAAAAILLDAELVRQCIIEGAGRITACHNLLPAGWRQDGPDGGLSGGTLTYICGLL